VLRLEVSVPPNTTARLLIPTKDASSVRESDRPAGESRGVKALGTEHGRAVFLLESGKYAFQAVP